MNLAPRHACPPNVGPLGPARITEDTPPRGAVVTTGMHLEVAARLVRTDLGKPSCKSPTPPPSRWPSLGGPRRNQSSEIAERSTYRDEQTMLVMQGVGHAEGPGSATNPGPKGVPLMDTVPRYGRLPDGGLVYCTRTNRRIRETCYTVALALAVGMGLVGALRWTWGLG